MRGGDGVVANGVEADGAIVNYGDIKLVLCDTLPPRRRVWHARLAAGGFVFTFGSISKGQAQSRRTLRPGGVVRRRCPSEKGPYFILRRYTAFRAQCSARDAPGAALPKTID